MSTVENKGWQDSREVCDLEDFLHDVGFLHIPDAECVCSALALIQGHRLDFL